MLGKAKTDLKNGKDVEQEFTAHVVMQEDKTSGELRVEFMQVYAVSSIPTRDVAELSIAC